MHQGVYNYEPTTVTLMPHPQAEGCEGILSPYWVQVHGIRAHAIDMSIKWLRLALTSEMD